MIKLDKIFNPKVLSALAVAGVVATAIMAALEGINGSDVVREAKKTAPKEGVWAISKHYIPRVTKAFWKTIVVGGITMTCIVTSCYLSGLQIVALSGTIAGLVSQRDAVEKEIVKLPGGKEALAKVKKEIALATAEKKSEKPKPFTMWKCQTIEETGHGDEIFIDEWGSRIFKSDLDHVQGGIDKVNDERDEGMDLPFSDKGDVNFPVATAFNDFYIAWDIEPSGLGATFGYPASDDYYDSRRIKFKIITLDEKDMDPVMWKRYGQRIHLISLDPDYYPMQAYLEY